MERNTAEIIVKVLGILGIIGSVFGFIIGILMLFGGSFFIGLMGSELAKSEVPAGLVQVAFYVFGILAVIFSAINLWIAIRLMQHKNWARIVVIIFAALGALGNLFSLPLSIIGLALNILVLYLLGFNEDVKGLFTGVRAKAVSVRASPAKKSSKKKSKK